jgi:hypothetical protein
MSWRVFLWCGDCDCDGVVDLCFFGKSGYVQSWLRVVIDKNGWDVLVFYGGRSLT